MRRLEVVVASLFIVALNESALAQRSNRLDIDVRVSAFTMAGDTIRLTYELESRASSATDLWTFALTTHVSSPRLAAPRDAHRWAAGMSHDDEHVPVWMARGENLKPGQVVTGLSFTAIGITDVVEFLAVPEAPTPTTSHDTTADDESEPVIEMRTRATRGRAVTVVAMPKPALAPKQRMARLVNFFEQACSAKWITGTSTCRDLRLRLTAATAAMAANDAASATADVKAFVSEMEAAGKSVSTTALALLKPNAAYALRP